MNNNKKTSIMREGGEKLARVRDRVLAEAKEGITTIELDQIAQRLIKEAGGKASFKLVEGYEWATCICVNDCIVHGVPNKYKLTKGDIVTVDIGFYYKGYHTDTADSAIIGARDDDFLRAGRETLKSAIAAAKAGNRVGHISQKIQHGIQERGYNVARTLVGHGIGKGLHEDPQIPCFLEEKLEETPELEEGMTLAVEVIYMENEVEVYVDSKDNWTVRTQDGSRSAMFEHTIAVTVPSPTILTY